MNKTNDDESTRDVLMCTKSTPACGLKNILLCRIHCNISLLWVFCRKEIPFHVSGVLFIFSRPISPKKGVHHAEKAPTYETVGCLVEVIADPHSLLSRTSPITQFDESNSENARVASSREPCCCSLYGSCMYIQIDRMAIVPDSICTNTFALQVRSIGNEFSIAEKWVVYIF